MNELMNECVIACLIDFMGCKRGLLQCFNKQTEHVRRTLSYVIQRAEDWNRPANRIQLRETLPSGRCKSCRKIL